jgi:hypothetical protein
VWKVGAAVEAVLMLKPEVLVFLKMGQIMFPLGQNPTLS